MDITGIEKLSQQSLESAGQKEWIWWPIALGAALGPVFSSCNPTYTVLLATILPVSLTMGLIGLIAYFIGLGLVLLLIVYFGRGAIGRFSFFANPRGLFRRMLGVIILIIWVLIVTGDIKKVETYVVEKNIFIDTASLDNTLNNILLKNHNDVGDMCKSGKCDTNKDSDVLMDIEKAPELSGLVAWINSSPLTLESLKGKVVLIDFWTYSCVNCQRTQPYLNAWYDKYQKDGLVILWIHAPEFAFEKVENNVRGAVKNAGIKYPVALDNDFKTWNAYGNRYWPAKYLIDQKGNIIFKHFWEGGYDEMEKNIQELLKVKSDTIQIQTNTSGTDKKTPEMYLGSSRAKNMIFEQWNFSDGPQSFFTTELKQVNQWTLFGPWKVTPEYIESLGEHTALILRFAARSVHLVVSSANHTGDIIVEVLNKKSQIIKMQTIPIHDDSLYTVFDAPEFVSDQIIKIRASDGLRLHAFTFWD